MPQFGSMLDLRRITPLLLVFPALAATPTPIAIKDAHIVVVSGPDLAKDTVVLRNGLIEDVGVNVSIPPDAWVIDGTGLTVYPGFIDGLSTWGIPSAAPPARPPQAAAHTPSSQPPPPPPRRSLRA